MTEPKLRLVKFGALGCAPCRSMDRAQTLERFKEAHPNVELVKHDTADKNWETPKGSAFAAADKIATKRRIKALPTLIFETAEGKEIERHEGGISYRDLERMYLDVLDELDPDKAAKDTEEAEEDEEESNEDGPEEGEEEEADEPEPDEGAEPERDPTEPRTKPKAKTKEAE